MNMNYYAKIYNDDYNPDDIKVHISIIEGIYEVNLRQKARVIGDVNITENTFCKYVKYPYDVINIEEYTITLKKNGEETYTLLSYLLTIEGYTPERIGEIITAIYNISNNISIKTNKNCLGNWIIFH
jgi:hypothetical protein